MRAACRKLWRRVGRHLMPRVERKAALMPCGVPRNFFLKSVEYSCSSLVAHLIEYYIPDAIWPPRV